MTARRATRNLWCASCDSAGAVLCFCGGDACHCGREEVACPDCDGASQPAYCEADDCIEELVTLIC
jgi:hypothetical protein